MNKEKWKPEFNLEAVKKWLKDKKIGTDKLILIGLAGIVLVLCSVFPGKKNESKETVKESEETSYEITREEYTEYMESRLKKILEQVEGAGNVQVMINYKSSWEKVILTENPYTYNKTNEEDGNGGKREVIENSREENVVYDADDMPYITKEVTPEILGIAVISDGGNNPVVVEKIINVIKALFEVSVNKIAVVGNGG